MSLANIFDSPKFVKNTDLQKECCKLIYSWCKKNLNESKYHDKCPKLIIRNQEDKHYKGYYKAEKNLICVYPKNNKSLLDLCETIIHEWKHYQQDIEYMYDRYIIEYGKTTKNHPYEISAENFGKKHAKNCSEWVRFNIT